MKLKIIAIQGKGELAKEVVWLEAIEDCELQYYQLSDTTYTAEDKISNELRHVFWFSNKKVKKGDLISLYTKDGTQTSVSNDRGTTTHTFYWKLGRTIWNKEGDCAVLFELKTWNTTKA